MKKYNSIFLITFVLLTSGITGCLKNADQIQSNTTTVTFNNSGLHFLTGDITVNPKDSLFFDFTITTQRDMKYVSIQKNGADITKDTLTDATKHSFSAVKKIAADSITGVYTFKVVAKDANGIYLGSSGFTVTVTPDFVYYTVRNLFVPDSVAKTAKCYFSTSTGKTYSYSDGPNNSAMIDFGYFYDTTTVGVTTANRPKHTIYALSASTFQPYDLTGWTKNATIFKKITTPTFANITSKGLLRTAAINALTSGTTSKFTSAGLSGGTLTGTVLVFKTAAGKYGVMTVNYTNQDGASPGTFINIDVKVEM